MLQEFTMRASADQRAEVAREAERQGVPAAELWRTAMAAYLDNRSGARLEARVERIERQLGIEPHPDPDRGGSSDPEPPSSGEPAER